MHTGMLWFDNSTTTLQVKIKKAVDYYEKKYGRKPDLCLINPAMAEPGQKSPFEIGGLKTLLYRPVLPGHIWIGLEDKS